jgi:hypothetical protein
MGTQYFRLTAEAYRALEKSLLSDIYVNDKTTEVQAGYMLGIQKALKEIRDGFTIETER